jgi:hypothetical protein
MMLIPAARQPTSASLLTLVMPLGLFALSSIPLPSYCEVLLR